MSEKTNPFTTRYFNETELKEFGFKSIGKNVRIAANCKIVGLENISIGNNVIIDSFCTIIAPEGYLEIGSFVHIGSFCHILASEGVEIKDFAGLSQGVKLYSKTDDLSGKSLTNPTIPRNYKNTKNGKVVLNQYVVIGAGSVVLPNVKIGEGSSVGALSLVTTNLGSWTMYFGNPLKKLAPRSNKILDLKKDFIKDMEDNPSAHLWKY